MTGKTAEETLLKHAPIVRGMTNTTIDNILAAVREYAAQETAILCDKLDDVNRTAHARKIEIEALEAKVGRINRKWQDTVCALQRANSKIVDMDQALDRLRDQKDSPTAEVLAAHKKRADYWSKRYDAVVQSVTELADRAQEIVDDEVPF